MYIHESESSPDQFDWLRAQVYSRPDRLSRRGSSGLYSNPRVPGSTAVLRALSAAILRCACSLDADAGEVSAAPGLPTGSGFDLVPRPADLSFARVRVRTKSWTPLPVTWTPHFPASISAMSRY